MTASRFRIVLYVITNLLAPWVSARTRRESLSPRRKLLIILPAVFTWGGLGAGTSLFTLFSVMSVKT